MSFNYSKLRGRIIEKFGTQGCFSKALGVSERTLSLKLIIKYSFLKMKLLKFLNY